MNFNSILIITTPLPICCFKEDRKQGIYKFWPKHHSLYASINGMPSPSVFGNLFKCSTIWEGQVIKSPSIPCIWEAIRLGFKCQIREFPILRARTVQNQVKSLTLPHPLPRGDSGTYHKLHRHIHSRVQSSPDTMAPSHNVREFRTSINQ